MEHIPVLLRETLEVLDPQSGDTVIDCTLGLGGHAKEFCTRIGKGHFIGIDADTTNLAFARERLRERNTTLIHANFGDIEALDLEPADVILADLGLSSPHIDDAQRGFSFQPGSPLDGRFDQSKGMSSADILNEYSEEKLVDLLKTYGEVPRPHPLARALVSARSTKPFTIADDLVAVAKDVYDFRAKKVLPQIFQSLRIVVNDEIDVLENLLRVAPSLLKSGGRLGIISYHSLEDRLVKQRFKELCEAPKHPVTGAPLNDAPYEILTKKPIAASEEERAENPRSRSARFRAILRSQ